MKRPDRPLVPQEHRRRPHVDAFADLTSIDESTLIEKSQLLDAIADDDDIEWKKDPFEMRPESENPVTPDEIIVMITFAGSPELQKQLRSLYIDPVPAHTGRPNSFRNRSSEVGDAAQPHAPSTPFR